MQICESMMQIWWFWQMKNSIKVILSHFVNYWDKKESRIMSKYVPL